VDKRFKVGGEIIGIWALVALPMALLGWVVAPAIIPYIPLPPGIPYWLLMIAGIIVSSLAITWPARRFRSNWMAIVVHGVEGLLGLVMVLAVILGW
jgi:hypothetical protein